MISIKLFIFSILFDSTFCWTPIGSIHNLNQITPIKIADKEYVVWKPDSNKDDFVVQDNICPHILAPLSECRIEDGNIQCGYHGW